MKRTVLTLAVILFAAVSSASAQSLGTFRWHLQPYGSVLELNVTQQGGIFLLAGSELQCGGNATLPVSGVAVVQANGSVILGLTTITLQGRGLHTRATVNTSDFNGFYSDNAGNTGETLSFNPGVTCPGGPRTDPTSPDPQVEGATIQGLLDQLAAVTARLAALEGRKP